MELEQEQLAMLDKNLLRSLIMKLLKREKNRKGYALKLDLIGSCLYEGFKPF